MLPLLVAVLLSQPSDPSILTVPVVSQHEAVQYEWLDKLSFCESSNRVNLKTLDTNNHYSYGLYQFQMRTWSNYKELGTTQENIYDPVLQRLVAKHILDRGGQNNWYICSKRIGNYPI